MKPSVFGKRKPVRTCVFPQNHQFLHCNSTKMLFSSAITALSLARLTLASPIDTSVKSDDGFSIPGIPGVPNFEFPISGASHGKSTKQSQVFHKHVTFHIKGKAYPAWSSDSRTVNIELQYVVSQDSIEGQIMAGVSAEAKLVSPSSKAAECMFDIRRFSSQ